MAKQRLIHVHFEKAGLFDDGEGRVYARAKVNCPLGCKKPVFLDALLIGRLHRGTFVILEEPYPCRNSQNPQQPTGFCNECGVQMRLCEDTEPAICKRAKEWGAQYSADRGKIRPVDCRP